MRKKVCIITEQREKSDNITSLQAYRANGMPYTLGCHTAGTTTSEKS